MKWSLLTVEITVASSQQPACIECFQNHFRMSLLNMEYLGSLSNWLTSRSYLMLKADHRGHTDSGRFALPGLGFSSSCWARLAAEGSQVNGATFLKVASFIRSCLDEVPGRDGNTKPWFVLIREHSESPVQEHPHSQLWQLHHSLYFRLSLEHSFLWKFSLDMNVRNLWRREMINDGLGNWN